MEWLGTLHGGILDRRFKPAAGKKAYQMIVCTVIVIPNEIGYPREIASSVEFASFIFPAIAALARTISASRERAAKLPK